MGEVPKVATPLDMAAVRARLRTRYGNLGGDLLAALIAVETSQGKRCFNWNVGNLSAGGFRTSGQEYFVSQSYWRPEWFNDASHRLHDAMLAGKVPSAFQAFGSLEDGMQAFERLLAQKGYEPLIRAANVGDVAAFVQALHETGYSKDYGPQHIPTFRSILQSWGVQTLQGSSQQGQGSSVVGWMVVGLTVALTVGVFWGTIRKRSRGNLSR